MDAGDTAVIGGTEEVIGTTATITNVKYKFTGMFRGYISGRVGS